MSDLRDEAQALADAMMIGVCEVAEVVAWADAQIARADSPPGALCDVSLAVGLHPQDVAAMLRGVPGAPVRRNVDQLLLSLLKRRLKRDANDADRIASILYGLLRDDRIEDPGLAGVARWAWDELDLSAGGYSQEPREQIVEQMVDAFNRAVADAVEIWSVELP